MHPYTIKRSSREVGFNLKKLYQPIWRLCKKHAYLTEQIQSFPIKTSYTNIGMSM